MLSCNWREIDVDDQAQDLTVKLAELLTELFAQEVKNRFENAKDRTMSEWVKNYGTSRPWALYICRGGLISSGRL